MPLILRIQSYCKEPPIDPVERRFDHLGGTIGRAPGNDLELPDPGKYISRNHGRIDFHEGSYTLVNLGSNPSFVNGRPIGMGRPTPLAHGDQLVIGDYVLQVHLESEAADEATLLTAPVEEELLAQDTLALARILDVGTGLDGGVPVAHDDPLGLGVLAQETSLVDPVLQNGVAFRGSESDHLAPQYHPMPGTASSLAIPDDYDLLADYLPKRPPSSAPVPASVTIPPVRQAPAQLEATRQDDSEVLRSLLKGLRLPDLETRLSPAELAELVGAMLREAVVGTMTVLKARTTTKRESRIEMTMIGSQANNPLKFFPDVDGALSQMLTNAMAGYMPPTQSIANAFDDLRAHELAVMAGMRTALAGVLQRFDPAAIEERLQVPTVMDKMLAANRKAKMWDRMVALYEDISREADDDFQRLFRDKFSTAYEEQIKRLRGG